MRGKQYLLDLMLNDFPVIPTVDSMENYFGANYVDLHLLKKEADGWKILAKAFTEFGE